MLPPARAPNGALCNLNTWALSNLIDESAGVTLVDAIFPRQFDDHICTIDSSGLLRFWNVFGGVLTTVSTGIQDACGFCFGLGR